MGNNQTFNERRFYPRQRLTKKVLEDLTIKKIELERPMVHMKEQLVDSIVFPLLEPQSISMFDMKNPKIIAIMNEKGYPMIPWSKTSFLLDKTEEDVNEHVSGITETIGWRVGSYTKAYNDDTQAQKGGFQYRPTHVHQSDDQTDVNCIFRHTTLCTRLDSNILCDLKTMAEKKYLDSNSDLYVVVGIYATTKLAVLNHSTSNDTEFVFALNLIKIS